MIWRLRKLWLGLRIPAGLLLVAAAWLYIPQLEARKQQDELATQFFAECVKTLKDTEQLPKVPDEALQQALKRAPLTDEAYRTWAPIVWSSVEKGKWVAHIQFSPPSGYRVEDVIGPALSDAGYDTPSAGS